jgi:hypothetical protein
MMRHRGHWAVALLITAALAASGCAKASHDEAASPEPARVEKIQGSDVNRLVLTAKAVERLGIATAAVGDVPPPKGGARRTVVNFSALIYEADGSAAVYTNPEPLVYVRAPVVVDTIERDQAFLANGPPPGTAVVTVGAPELFGIDSGIGGNE